MKLAIYIGTFYTAPLLSDKVGGSEIMAVQLGEALLRQNGITKVVIYGALNQNDDGKLTSGGVECRTWQRMFSDTEMFDSLIISRFVYTFYFYNLARFNKLFYWMHDCIFHPSAVIYDKHTGEISATTYNEHGIPAFNEICHKIEKIIMVSQWQMDNLRRISTHIKDEAFAKCQVIPNALPDELFNYDISNKKPHSFILTTDPTRAMPNILQMWPTIRQHFKDATLDIYFYGMVSDEDIATMNKYKADGISWKGRALPDDIYKHVSKAQYYLYPFISHETFGLSTVQASALGCHVIASDYSGVGETGRLIGSCLVPKDLDIKQYTEKVINYMHKVDQSDYGEYIESCRQRVRQYYSWGNVITQWVNILLPHQTHPSR